MMLGEQRNLLLPLSVSLSQSLSLFLINTSQVCELLLKAGSQALGKMDYKKHTPYQKARGYQLRELFLAYYNSTAFDFLRDAGLSSPSSSSSKDEEW